MSHNDCFCHEDDFEMDIEIGKRLSYINGLIDGIYSDKDDPTGKIFRELSHVIEEIAHKQEMSEYNDLFDGFDDDDECDCSDDDDCGCHCGCEDDGWNFEDLDELGTHAHCYNHDHHDHHGHHHHHGHHFAEIEDYDHHCGCSCDHDDEDNIELNHLLFDHGYPAFDHKLAHHHHSEDDHGHSHSGGGHEHHHHEDDESKGPTSGGRPLKRIE